jgi:hypothetical protein
MTCSTYNCDRSYRLCVACSVQHIAGFQPDITLCWKEMPYFSNEEAAWPGNSCRFLLPGVRVCSNRAGISRVKCKGVNRGG